MRIVSYNILNGAEGRADPVAEIIEAQRPDVVGLVEADLPEVVERIANRLKMDFVHAPASRHAAAVLSRFPIIESINHGRLRACGGFGGTLLEVIIRDARGADWPMAAVHLHAHAAEEDEAIRQKEIEVVLDAMARHRRANRPHLLMGDFNANSLIQQIDPERVKPSTREEWQKNGGCLPRRVVQKLLSAGYADTLATAAGEAQAATSYSFSTQHPGQRVDYIFAWNLAPSRIKKAWIEQDRLAKYASDHFPIGLEIE